MPEQPIQSLSDIIKLMFQDKPTQQAQGRFTRTPITFQPHDLAWRPDVTGQYDANNMHVPMLFHPQIGIRLPQYATDPASNPQVEQTIGHEQIHNLLDPRSTGAPSLPNAGSNPLWQKMLESWYSSGRAGAASDEIPAYAFSNSSLLQNLAPKDLDSFRQAYLQVLPAEKRVTLQRIMNANATPSIGTPFDYMDYLQGAR